MRMSANKRYVCAILVGMALMYCSIGLQESMLSFYVGSSSDKYYHADKNCKAIGHSLDEMALELRFDEILPEFDACPYCLGAAKAMNEMWDYPISREILEDPQDFLRLVNKDNLLEKSYPNQDIEMYQLVKVTAPVTKGTLELRAVANDAMCEMIEAAQKEGIKLYVGSAYRSYRTQEVIHYNRKKQLGYDDGYTQVAGGSEHQTGLAADVVSWEYRNKFQQSFGEKKEGIWLRENCARFGFIIRYPKDKEEITGVQYEPWHVRYVGREAAEYIMGSGMTFEEFTQEYIQSSVLGD